VAKQHFPADRTGSRIEDGDEDEDEDEDG